MPGKGTATFHRMIEELEARYTGKKGSTEGYDSDGGFLADEVRRLQQITFFQAKQRSQLNWQLIFCAK